MKKKNIEINDIEYAFKAINEYIKNDYIKKLLLEALWDECSTTERTLLIKYGYKIEDLKRKLNYEINKRQN